MACIIIFIAVMVLVATSIHHSLCSAVKLARYYWSTVPRCQSPPKALSHPLRKVASFSFLLFSPSPSLFTAPLMSFHFYSGTMKTIANYAKLQVREAPRQVSSRSSSLAVQPVAIARSAPAQWSDKRRFHQTVSSN